MNTALYIDEGRVQVVLTAEGKFDEQILGRIQNHKGAVRIEHGAMYGCQGGWNRHRKVFPDMGYTRNEDKDDDSIFLVLDEPVKEPVLAEPVVDPLKEAIRELLRCRTDAAGSTMIPPGYRAVIIPGELHATLQALVKLYP